jgi:hypothetical protein
MEAKNQEFILQNLSDKSSLYILNDLFNKKERIEAEMPSFNNKMDNVFVVGQLNNDEFELYIIMDSLLRRIKGTKARINDMLADHEEAVLLLRQRENRLTELRSDWDKVRNFLYTKIEVKFQKEIQELFLSQPKLLKTRFHCSDYNAYAGYIFVFFTHRQFGITNYFPVGGD